MEEEIKLLHTKIGKGLADPKRILILYLLSKNSMTVNELAETLNIPQPTVSHHLKILRDRGMVLAERKGTTACYSLTDPRVIEALDLLRVILADQLAKQTTIMDITYNSVY